MPRLGNLNCVESDLTCWCTLILNTCSDGQRAVLLLYCNQEQWLLLCNNVYTLETYTPRGTADLICEMPFRR